MASINTITGGGTHGDGVLLAETSTEKLGFWGATPVVQPSGAAQADQGAMTFSAGSIDTGTDMTAAQAAALEADIAALDTIVTALRSALVTAGIIKGSA